MTTTNEQHMQIIESEIERLKNRYNPENDAGQVTWVDARFITIIEHLLDIVDNLNKKGIQP